MDAQAAYKAYKGMSLGEREFLVDYIKNPLSSPDKRYVSILAILTLRVFESRLTPAQRAEYIHALDRQWEMVH